MKIKVISQNTSERNKETRDNFEKIRPFLDEGNTYINSCILAGLANGRSIGRMKWFKEIVSYGETQGYLHKDFKGSGVHRKRGGND